MSKQNTFKAGSPGLQSPSNILSPKEKEKSEMEKYANELVMAGIYCCFIYRND